LHQRTEGWAAGLRLAVLSLADHPDPERFVAEFSGSNRTVAEYLIAEMMERQPVAVQDLLLRTCLLDQVNGELAARGPPSIQSCPRDRARALLAVISQTSLALKVWPPITGQSFSAEFDCASDFAGRPAWRARWLARAQGRVSQQGQPAGAAEEI
jgi:hypothetical protein